MSSEARIRILLEQAGRKDDVWVSVCPITQNDLLGALSATGNVVTQFIAHLAADEERSDAVSRWLSGEDLW